MKINDFNTTSDAIANGVSTNKASAIIVNDQGNYEPNVSVVFTVSGAAVFSNGLQEIISKSNVLGNISVEFANKVSETVIVTIMIEGDPDSKLSLSSEFGASSGNIDAIRLLATVDGAVADGVDTNEVVIQTVDGALPIGGAKVSVSLSNGAVFINGESNVDIETNESGITSLIFTNTHAGSTVFAAYLTDNIAIYSKIETNFSVVAQDVDVKLVVISDNAVANGQANNVVEIIVTDKLTEQFLSGIEVNCSVSGSAQIVYGQSNTTNSQGSAIVAISDSTEEDVIVTVNVLDKTVSTTISFTEQEEPIKISRVYNVNKEFEVGGPTVAWRGAEFYIEAVGGSGHYEWSITDGPNALYISETNGNRVTLKFSDTTSAQAKQTYKITLVDGSQTIDYIFTINLFFIEFEHWEFYESQEKYPSLEELTQLYREWGAMSIYDGWGGEKHYAGKVIFLLR